MKQLKGLIWAWAENILRREGKVSEYLNPADASLDQNQNNLMDVYIGLDSYWKIDSLLDIAADFKRKKILKKQSRLRNRDNSKSIAKINARSMNKVEKLLQM